MRKTIIALVLATLLGNHLTTFAQAPSTQEIKLKQKIVEYGTNKMVKIKLNSSEMLEGRIAEIKNESFTLQLVEAAGRITSRDLAYSELHKVSKAGGPKVNADLKRGFLQTLGGAIAVVVVITLTTVIIGATVD